MADEAFALSPISARPVLPGEADYDAIREAFMETSRGRWFLREYAKRNRNTDTAMVLDAVARIEETLAAQRQEGTRKESLAEALAAVRGAVDRANEVATAAFAGLQLEENLAPILKGTRIIKEISWRWREIGADGRICDLIDSQLAAIEASCGRIAEADGSAALNAAFDLLKHKLDELGEVDDAPAAKATTRTVTRPAPAVTEQATNSAAKPPPAEARTARATAKVEVPSPVARTRDAIVEPDAPAEAEAAAIELPETSQEAADAQDEAILELIAIEMAAPDPVEDFPPEQTAKTDKKRPAAEPVIASPPQPAPAPPPAAQVSPPAVKKLPEPAPPLGVEPSLGSTIIATGILQRSKASSDPLAPIRRMSQAEKIAFFS